MSRVKRVFPDLPFITASINTKIVVTDANDYALGYTHINTLIDTIDTGGLATDGENIFTGDQLIFGNLTINGDIIAQQFLVTSSSITHYTASTNFGLDDGDTHTFTGSVKITGSLDVIGATTALGNTIISGTVFISGSTELGGNIVPKTARGATLGTLERPFSEIYVSSGSINIASDVIGDPNTTLSNVGGNILVSAGGMRLLGNASFIATTGSFQYLSGSFTHIGSQFNDGDIVTTGSLSVSGSTIMIGNNTMTGNTQLTGSVNITGSLNVNGQPVVLGPMGWARYDDTQYTTASAYTLSVGSKQTLPNNGGNRVETHLESSISFYDSGSQKIQVENSGDVYMCTITFKASTANSNGTYVRLQLDNIDGTPYSRVGKDLFFPKGNGVWHDYHEVFQYYADSDFVTNGNKWTVEAFANNVDISNIILFIQRTQNHLV